MAKILVTGGAGFVGLNITRLLAEDSSNEIHIIDNLSKTGMDKDLEEMIAKDNVVFHKKELTELSTYSDLDTDFDQVYHVAAVVGVRKVMENPVMTLRYNTLPTIYLLDWAATLEKKPKMLFTSSCENYAGSIKHANVPVPTPEDVPLCIEDIYNPRWTYASSKILGEIAFMQYAKEYGIPATVIRYHNVFGPRMGPYHVIPEFVARINKKSEIFEMFGGDQYRSFCYVTDGARMTINVMKSPDTNGKVVNIGNDHDYMMISEIAEMLFDIAGVSCKLAEKGAPQGSTQNRKPNVELLRKLGCDSHEVDFKEGLRQTYDWYTANPS